VRWWPTPCVTFITFQTIQVSNLWRFPLERNSPCFNEYTMWLLLARKWYSTLETRDRRQHRKWRFIIETGTYIVWYTLKDFFFLFFLVNMISFKMSYYLLFKWPKVINGLYAINKCSWRTLGSFHLDGLLKFYSFKSRDPAIQNFFDLGYTERKKQCIRHAAIWPAKTTTTYRMLSMQ